MGLLTSVVFGPVSAYTDPTFSHLSVEQGLAQSAVQDMVSDEFGYLWLGTQYGLSRYDGYGFRNFRRIPGDPTSLSNSRIQDLLLGSDGRLWVGTRSGLNRLDPGTLRIERIPLEGADPGAEAPAPPQIIEMAEGAGGDLLIESTDGLLHLDYSTGRLRRVETRPMPEDGRGGTVAADRDGRLWWLSSDGLWRLDPERLSMVNALDLAGDPRAVRRGALAVMASGIMAMVADSGVVFFDPDSRQVVERAALPEGVAESDSVGSVSADPEGGLWALGKKHLYQYDEDSDSWRIRLDRAPYGFEIGGQVHGLNSVRDANGYLWVGLPEGIGLVPPDGDSFRLLQHDPGDPGSIKGSPWLSAYEVAVDRFGVVWIGGGLGGLSRFAPQQARFEHVIDRRLIPGRGTNNVVRSVLEVQNGEHLDLWAGHGFGGIRVWRRESGRFHRIVAELDTLAAEPFKLPDSQVRELERHPSSGEIWAGTGDGLVAISPHDFSVQRRVPVRVADRPLRIEAIEFSEDGRTLFAVGGKRLVRAELDEAGRRVVDLEVAAFAPTTVTDNEHAAFNMIKLSDGRLLIGTRRGLVLWDPATNHWTHEYPAGQPGEHRRNFVFALAESGDGDIWIGTEMAGLARSRIVEGGFEPWRWTDTSGGLPDDTVYAILPAPSGRLWLSSNRGLTRFNPATGMVRQFTQDDGLQALEFNNTVATIGQSGRFYFGGIKGINVFRPESIRLHREPPVVLLQRARLGDEVLPIEAGQISRAQAPYDRNTLVAEFVGLHFVQPHRNRYAYRLEGVDEGWVDGQGGRLVRYPDLSPGAYDLKVRAANSDGIWSEPTTLLSFEVLPPVWTTAWAYAFYVALGASLIGLYTMTERRRRMRLEADVAQRTLELTEQKELVDRQARALEESLETRTTLFANISHEFRTPLTLIEASLERLVRNPNDEAAFAAARRYLRRLLRLVDQLLNLSRLQASSQQTPPDPWSLDQVVAMTVDAFRPLAEEKGMTLSFDCDGRWSTQCQQADVERILLNLLGNAFKYCPGGSTIRVALEEAENGVVISVADDGPGIAIGEQEKIFERFNRTPAHEQGRIEGAGIGLTLVREAARSNGGDAIVESEPGHGAEFRVQLPAWRGHIQGAPVDQLAPQRLQLELETLAIEGDEVDSEDFEDGPLEGRSAGRLGRVLVAEDNRDLRNHLADVLASDWQVLLAEDGQEALAMARERAPDVVVSDVMMPRLDGLELLKRLREDVRTSHLPVLLLTARTDDETRLRGFSLSADDFVAKPFSADELRLRLRRMVDIRAHVQSRLRRQMEISGHVAATPSGGGGEDAAPDLSDRDRQLLDRIQSWLEANHDDPDAGVSALAVFLSMDSRTLQRKLRALTGRTPAEHLRHYRLGQARRMLRESDASIQEIAYSCGFSSPQYFSRLFAQEEGEPPSSWRDQSAG